MPSYHCPCCGGFHAEGDGEIARLRAEVETYKRLYKLRGQALRRPCLQCGYEPARITLADGSVEEKTVG